MEVPSSTLQIKQLFLWCVNVWLHNTDEATGSPARPSPFKRKN